MTTVDEHLPPAPTTHAHTPAPPRPAPPRPAPPRPARRPVPPRPAPPRLPSSSPPRHVSLDSCKALSAGSSLSNATHLNINSPASAPNSATALHREHALPEAQREPAKPHREGPHTFQRVREQVAISWANILPTPKTVRRFEHTAIVSMMNARLEVQKLKKESGGPDKAVQLVAEHRPAHEFTKFICELQELQKVLSNGIRLSSVPLWSVSTKPMAPHMKRRGFIQLAHHPVEERSIPIFEETIS
ncbi:hypothetical protein AB1Y20_010727 [Prymnesium parvum]|uniref:Uncharacterized protein n=1 Tax=Prymnesium parvum TaxID=97485 RepID=A0AB34IPJ8_PRYPA